MKEITEVELRREMESTAEAARSVVVNSHESYIAAGKLLMAVKSIRKQVIDYFAPLKANAHKTWKSICSRESEELAKLEPAAAHLGKLMVAWEQKEAQKRREEEMRLREAARKAEEDRLLTAAIEAEKAGKKEEAEKIIMQEPVFVAPPVVAAPTKIEGLATRTIWKFEVVDERLIPREYLMPNLVKIGQIVRTLKEEAKIQGVRIYSETQKTSTGK